MLMKTKNIGQSSNNSTSIARGSVEYSSMMFVHFNRSNCPLRLPISQPQTNPSPAPPETVISICPPN